MNCKKPGTRDPRSWIAVQSIHRAVWVPLAELVLRSIFFCVMNLDDLSLQDSVRSQSRRWRLLGRDNQNTFWLFLSSLGLF